MPSMRWLPTCGTAVLRTASLLRSRAAEKCSPRTFPAPRRVATNYRTASIWFDRAALIELTLAEAPLRVPVAVAAHRAPQPEISPQRAPLVFAAEQSAPLQFGHDQRDEVVDPLGQHRGRNVDPVGGSRLEPFLHLVGDIGGGADLPQRAAADHGEIKLADGRVFAPPPFA